MPQCHYTANTVAMWYQRHKFFATGVDFDVDGVEQNQQERVVLGVIFSVHQFLVLSITFFEHVSSTYRFFGAL